MLAARATVTGVTTHAGCNRHHAVGSRTRELGNPVADRIGTDPQGRRGHGRHPRAGRDVRAEHPWRGPDRVLRRAPRHQRHQSAPLHHVGAGGACHDSGRRRQRRGPAGRDAGAGSRDGGGGHDGRRAGTGTRQQPFWPSLALQLHGRPGRVREPDRQQRQHHDRALGRQRGAAGQQPVRLRLPQPGGRPGDPRHGHQRRGAGQDTQRGQSRAADPRHPGRPTARASPPRTPTKP